MILPCAACPGSNPAFSFFFFKPPQFVDIPLEDEEDSSDDEYYPDEEEEDETAEEVQTCPDLNTVIGALMRFSFGVVDERCGCVCSQTIVESDLDSIASSPRVSTRTRSCTPVDLSECDAEKSNSPQSVMFTHGRINPNYRHTRPSEQLRIKGLRSRAQK